MMVELYQDKNVELEKIIIGSMIIDKNCADVIFANLNETDFYLEDLKLILNSALRVHTSAKHIDIVTLKNDMRENNEPNLVNLMIECSNMVGSTANIESHIYFLKNISAKRKITECGYDIIQKSHNDSILPIDQICEILTDITEIQNRLVQKKIKTFKEIVLETIDENLSGQKSFLGIKTGFAKYDSITGGYCSPDFTIIAAGPGEGKSTYALNQAKHIALSGKKVLFFSFEMKEKQLIWKLLSDELNISVMDVRLGHYKSDHALKTKLIDANLSIYDKGGLTIDDLVSIVKMERKINGIDIVFIDYLQLLRIGSYYRKISNKHDEVTIISNKLKQLCMDVDIPIIALSQLNRDKSRKRYGLSDLRDSGSLEQDADNVVFIFRPYEHQMTYYEIDFKEIVCNENTAIINIEKCRLGQTGEYEMIFNGVCSRFEDLGQSYNVF